MRTFAPTLVLSHDTASAAAEAADRVAAALVEGRVLGLATGATMAPLYRTLRDRLAGRRLPAKGIIGIALDEYVGLPPTYPESFRAYLDRAFAGPFGLGRGQVIVPDGMADDRLAAASRHEAAIAAAGGIDLQLLGIGANGHIGFNEPGSPLDSRTRDVDLSAETRAAQIAAFGTIGAVPTRAITVGIGTILDARRLLMLVTGEAKAAALAAALTGPIDPVCPASSLRLHPDATVICDPAAASKLGVLLGGQRVREIC